MSGSTWGRYVAIVGIALALASSTIEAQVQEPEVNQQQGQAETDKPQTDIPDTTVTPDDRVEESTPSSEETAQERAERREIEDLVAQQGMAQSTKRMSDITFWQTILLSVGTFALIVTLVLTRKATIAAQSAVRAADETTVLTREMFQRQLRAYLTVSSCSVDVLKDRSGIILTAHLMNSGETPAFNLRLMGESFASDYPLSEERPHPVPGTDFGTLVGSGSETACAQRIFTNDVEDCFNMVKKGEIGLWIQGTAIYDDCFGAQHTLKFRYVFGGRLANSGGMVLHADKEGNYAD